MKAAKFLTLLLGVVLLLAFTYALSPPSHSQTKSQNANTHVDEMPIADLATPEAEDPSQRALRRLRSKRHDIKDAGIDIQRFQLTENSPPVLLSLPLSHSAKEPAFPVAESDVIVIGEITAANAYLSNDKTSVYSEFVVSVEQVPRDTRRVPVFAGSSIVVGRSGGRVRLTTGKLLVRGAPYGRGMPLIGSRYALFLKTNEESQDFDLITGYELRSGKAFPLDHTPDGEKPFPQLAGYESYSGVAEATFLAELQCAISEGSKR